jgi:hypothetical protein
MVPPSHERPSLIQKLHTKVGHFGVKLTYSLLALHYHWKGIYAQVQNVIEWKLPSPLNNSCFSHPYSRHVLLLVVWFSWNYHRPPGVMSTSWLWLNIFQNGLNLLHSKLCAVPPTELESYHHHVNLDSSIWLSMSSMSEMLIKCYFAISVMVDTIYYASSQSSYKFPPAFGTVHHVLLQHLDFYSDHATFFLA